MRILTVLTLLLLLSACQSQDRHEIIAEELCNCMRPLATQYERVLNLTESGQPAEVEALLSDLEAAADESEACAEDLEAKYGDLEEEKEKVEAAMQKICPDITAMISELGEEVE